MTTSSITFFEPLKEDGPLGKSGVFQSVLGFFNRKGSSVFENELTSSVPVHFESSSGTSNSGKSNAAVVIDDLHFSPRTENKSQEPIKKDPSSLDLGSSSSGRPFTLGITPAYKVRDTMQMMSGNEVEIRLRNLSTIFKDLPKIIARRSSQESEPEMGLRTSSSGDSLRQYWMPDKHCHECYECGDRFTTFRRRHHCRICGHIFCSRCCFQLIPGHLIGHAGMLRSCTYCFSLLMSYTKPHQRGVTPQTLLTSEHDLPSEVSHDAATMNNSMNFDHLSLNNLKHQLKLSRSKSLISIRGSPVDEIPSMTSIASPIAGDFQNWTSPYDVFDVTSGTMNELDDAYANDQAVLAKDSMLELWQKIVDDTNGLEFRDHRFRLRKFTNSITGTELVDWLLKIEMTDDRQHACVIGQALLNADLIKNVTDEKIFHDEYCLYQYGTNAIKKHQSKSTKHNLNRALRKHTNILSTNTPANNDSEPNWVQEISNDEDCSDHLSSSFDEKENILFWQKGLIKSPHKFSSTDLRLSEEDSISSSSPHSVSSFVEIDNQRNVIKYKRSNVQSARELIPRKENQGFSQPKFVDDSLTEISAEYLRGYLAWNGTYLSNTRVESTEGWREGTLHYTNIPNQSKQAFIKLQNIYFQHAMKFLLQLLETKGLDLAWADVIVPLAKHISQTVSPNSEVNMDICHYVHVKQLLDGIPEDSRLISGVVFSKNVVHNRMRTRIDNPTIMLLATSLEYQRVQYKLSSLDPIVQQEPEFFKHLVSRIVSRNPDLIISECSVSHEARRLLLDAGITLIIKVKKSVMERLARCTGADVVYSIDQLQNIKLGSCGRFRVSRHDNGKRKICCSDGLISNKLKHSALIDSYKTLIYLDGCNISEGCTVLLRNLPCYENDASNADFLTKQQLEKVKQVLLFLVRIMYHSRLEISYLLDQQDYASTMTHTAAKLNRKSSTKRRKVEDLKPQNKDFSSDDSADDTLEQITHTTTPPSTHSEVLDCSDIEKSEYFSFIQSHPPKTFDVENTSSESSTLEIADKSNTPSNIFVNCLSKTMLSISPFVYPCSPFLLTSDGENTALRKYLPETLFWSDSFWQLGQSKSIISDWIGKMRKRAPSNGRLDCGSSENLSIKNKFSAKAAFQDNMWSTPQYQKNGETETLVNNDDSRDLIHAAELAMDQEESTTGKENAKNNQGPSRSSNKPNKHRRLASQTSTRSHYVKEEMFLLAWEKSMMRDVLGYEIEKSKPLTSSPKIPRKNKVFQPIKVKSENHNFSSNITVVENMEWGERTHSFLTTPLSKPASATEMGDMIASFRASGACLQPVSSQHKPRPLPPHRHRHPREEPEVLCERDDEEYLPPLDCLTPHNHQHIYVLFSSYSLRSPNAPYPCVNPWSVDIDYYRGNDITLGGFLERYCFRPSYSCPSPTCKRPMVEHVRSFVHGNTCMSIVLKELSKAVNLQNILSWCWNPHTKTSTDIKALSDDVWAMSFAKFLELRLQTYNKTDLSTANGSIEENAKFPSFQYFLFRDIVASFKCYEIAVYEVALPSSQINFEASTTDWGCLQICCSDQNHDELVPEYKQFVKTMNHLSKIGYEAMDAIHDMVLSARANNPIEILTSDPTDNGLDTAGLSKARDNYFDDLLTVYQDDRNKLRKMVDSIHLELQSIKIKQIVTPSNINCENKTLTSNENVSGNSDVEYIDMQMKDNTIQEYVTSIDQNCRELLSHNLLELTCLICQNVYDWNSRVTCIIDQDRNLRKGSRSTYYTELPQSADGGNTGSVDGKTKRVNPLPALVEIISEENHEEDENAEEMSPDLGEEESLEDVAKEEETQRESNPPLNSDPLDPSDLGTLVNKNISGNKDSSTPIQMPTSLSRQSSMGGVKRFSRSASSLSTFVSNLLSSNINLLVENPFPPDSHYLLPHCASSNVVVRDLEPSSIIAYSLCMPVYKMYMSAESDKIASIFQESNTTSKPSTAENNCQAKETDSVTSVDEQQETDFKIEFKGSKHAARKLSTLSAPKPGPGSSPLPSPPSSPGHRPASHIEVQFGDNTTKFYCKIYFAAEFKALREQIMVNQEDSYIKSLSRCVRWAARGGKSGSAFHKTIDDRFVLKQMSRFELQSFLELAQSYLKYIKEAAHDKSPTTLSKILGVYRVSYRNTSTAKTFKQDILVMENLFYRRNIQQVFDLKGSVRNRRVKTDVENQPFSHSSFGGLSNAASSTNLNSGDNSVTNRNDLVLLDENLLSIMRDRPLYIHEHTKLLITKALCDDARFLSNHSIIDYSLLVGIDEDKREIVVGIIDYMRTFTWDKKLEMVVKSYGMMGRQGTRSMPTVVSPELYRNRFCDAMDRYFQGVPDRWYDMHAYHVKIPS